MCDISCGNLRIVVFEQNLKMVVQNEFFTYFQIKILWLEEENVNYVLISVWKVCKIYILLCKTVHDVCKIMYSSWKLNNSNGGG